MIYFVQPKYMRYGPIKIGYTSDLEKRHHELELFYGVPFTILMTLPGNKRVERDMHSRFAHLRLAKPDKPYILTEQFRPGADLAEFLKPSAEIEVPPEDHPVVALTRHIAGLRCGRKSRDEAMASTRLTMAAYEHAKMVADLRGTSAVTYISEVVLAAAKADIARAIEELEAFDLESEIAMIKAKHASRRAELAVFVKSSKHKPASE